MENVQKILTAISTRHSHAYSTPVAATSMRERYCSDIIHIKKKTTVEVMEV